GNAPGTYFSSPTAFTINLSQPDGTGLVPAATFYSANVPAPLPLAASTIVQTFAIPSGTLPGSQYVASVSVGDSLNLASCSSQLLALAASFCTPPQLIGSIQCPSPAITYCTLTLAHTGLVPDEYGLTTAQSSYPLGSSFLSLAGSPISRTPQPD